MTEKLLVPDIGDFENVEVIDRNTKKQSRKNIINSFVQKEIKILVSTHAIFSANLSQASIGLVIIDEEQRFGVSHKEKIKKIKNNVHLLTLTAVKVNKCTLFLIFLIFSL